MLSISCSDPPPPCPAPFNLAAHVLNRADQLSDKVALAILGLSGAERWSYERLKAAALSTGTGLLQIGLKPGDKVLMRLGNTVDFPIAYLGAIAVGLIPIPTSAQLKEHEVASILDMLSPDAVLHDPNVPCPEVNKPTVSIQDLRTMQNLPPADYEMGSPERLAYIIYTSGTSGTPQAVEHAHRAIWARQMMIKGWYGLEETDRLMHAGAFNWTYTLGTGLMDPWTIGATALIPAPEVTPEQLPLLMKRHDTTIFAAAPGVYRKFLKSKDKISLPKLRHGLSAGEKLSSKIEADWKAATGCELYEAYGLSECSTFISASPNRPAPNGALGYPQPGRCVAILGENGPTAIEEPGQIAVHRDDPGLMLNYLGAPEATRAKFQDEWFLTGDMAIMHEDHTITYLGRNDDMMNAGGFRVSPLEVEAVLSTFPGLNGIAVTDVEIKTDVRLIVAFYTGPKPLDHNTLARFAADHLAAYKCPRDYFHLDALPTSANGKLLRRALRPIYEALHGQA